MQIARLKLEGNSNREIAAKMGRHHLKVGKLLKSEELAEMIKAEAGRLIERGLRPACENIMGLVKESMTKDGKKDKDLRKLGLDASKHITNIAGISGSAPSTVVNTMIQVNQNTDRVNELSNVQKFLAHQWGIKDEEVQDAEVEETDADRDK